MLWCILFYSCLYAKTGSGRRAGGLSNKTDRPDIASKLELDDARSSEDVSSADKDQRPLDKREQNTAKTAATSPAEPAAPGTASESNKKVIADEKELLKIVKKRNDNFIEKFKVLEKKHEKKLIEDIKKLDKKEKDNEGRAGSNKENSVSAAENKEGSHVHSLQNEPVQKGSKAAQSSTDASPVIVLAPKPSAPTLQINHNVQKLSFTTKNTITSQEKQKDAASDTLHTSSASNTPSNLSTVATSSNKPPTMPESPVRKLTDIFFKSAVATKQGILTSADAEILFENINKLKSLKAQLERIYESEMSILNKFVVGKDPQTSGFNEQEKPKDVMKYQVIEVTDKKSNNKV